MTTEMLKIPMLINMLRIIRMEMIFFIMLCLPFLFDSSAIY